MRALDVKVMCEVYGADENITEALMALAKATRDPGWWHAYGDTVPAWFELYVGLEQAASGLRIYEPEAVPGLLQTADYAREVIRVCSPELSEQEVERTVQVRLTRQQLFNRKLPPAPRVDVIMGEAAIKRMENTPGDMRGQLLQLLQFAKRPGVSVAILPLPERVTPTVSTGPFTILDFPTKGGKPSEPTTVYCQGLTGALYLDQPHEVQKFEDMWASIADDSLTGEDAINLLEKKAGELS